MKAHSKAPRVKEVKNLTYCASYLRYSEDAIKYCKEEIYDRIR